MTTRELRTPPRSRSAGGERSSRRDARRAARSHAASWGLAALLLAATAPRIAVAVQTPTPGQMSAILDLLLDDDRSADLTVRGVTGPAVADVGAKIAVNAQFLSAANAPRIYQPGAVFFLATDAALTNRVVRLCSARTVLLPGTATTDGCSGIVPPTLAIGTYYLGAVIDPDNKYAEPDETNNVAVGGTIEVRYETPDLSASNVTGPAGADAGTTITVGADFASAPGAPTSYDVGAVFYLATDAALTNRVATLCTVNPLLVAGTSVTASCSGTVPELLASGAYYLGVVIDPAGSVAESSETNNLAVGAPIQVTFHPPDFALRKVTAPASVESGATFRLSAELASAADASATYQPVLAFYLAKDAALTERIASLGRHAVALPRGVVTTSDTSTSLPPLLPSGTYYLGAVIDDDGAVAETDETNNVAVTAIQAIYVPPDLSVRGVKGPAAADAGASITVTADFVLASAARSSFTVDGELFLASDAALTNRVARLCAVHPVLEAKSAETVATASCTGTVPDTLTTGTYYLGASIDAAGAVVESDETNNVAAGNAIQVTFRLPDFTVRAVTGTTTVDVGATITVGAEFASAAGASSSYAPTAAFYLATDAALANRVARLCTVSPVLAPGTATTASCSGVIPALAYGSYHLGAVIDDAGTISETDEQNNVAAGATVLLRPDLFVTALSAPSLAAAGTSIVVSDSVRNRGTQSKAPSPLGYYLSADPAVTPQDVLVGTRPVVPVAPLGSSDGSATLQLPPGISGVWYLAALPGPDQGAGAAGVEPSVAVTIEVVDDAAPPEIAFTGVADGEVTSALPLSVCYAVTDRYVVSDEGRLDGDVPFRGCATVATEGSHLVTVTAMDLAGHVTTAAVSFSVDVTPPTVVISGVTDGWVGHDPSVTPTVVASDVHLASVAATLDGDFFQIGSTVKAEGDHLLAVVAMDAAGNSSTARVSFSLDRLPPKIAFSGVVDGAVYGAAVTPVVSVSDPHPGSHALTLDGHSGYVAGTAIEAEGEHVLLASATDAVGNTTTAQVSFAIDRTAPRITIVAPADGAVTAAASIQVVATVEEDHGAAQVTIGDVTVARGADGRYRRSIALAEGLNTIAVVARDGVGNVRTQPVSVRRDTAQPALVVDSPVEGATVESASVTVHGTVKDDSGVKVHVAGAPVNVDAAGVFQATVTLGAGKQAIEVDATDAAGNKQTVVRNVTVPDAPPVLVVTEPQAGFVATRSPITVRGTATSNTGGAVTVTVNQAQVAVSGGAFSTTVDAAPGPVTITVVATDAAGRTTTRSVTGTRGTETRPDEPPPAGNLVLSVDGPADGAILGSGAVAVSGRVEGGTAPVTVTVAGQSTLATAGYFNVALSLVEGDQTLVIKAADAAGHAVFAERKVSVDHTPPYVEITRPSAASAQASESPYLVQGTVGDVHLASVTVGGTPATVLGGQFSCAVPLQVGDNDVEVVAKDAAGNTTTRALRLFIAALPPVVTVLDPLDGAQASAAVVRVRAHVEATSAVQKVTIGTGTAALEAGDWVANVALALGDNTISVVATDASGLSGSATVHVRYRDATKEPLAVTGVDPAPGASEAETNALVSVSFNKAIDAGSLPGHFTVSVDGAPLAGGYYVAPGAQTVSFVAKAPLPAGKRVDVRVDGVAPKDGPGMQGAFASQFSVRSRRLEVVGHLLDAQLQPLEGVQVSVEGTGFSTRTGAEGSWHLLGIKPGAVVLRFEGGALGGGETLPVVRRRLFVSGSESTTDPNLVMVPVDRSALSRVDARSEMHLDFSGVHGPLAVDVPTGGLYFADGKTSGFVTATRIPAYAIPVPIQNGKALLAGVWQLQPAGIRITAPVELTFPNLTKLPAGRYAAVYGYDPTRHMLERVGLARVSADGAVLRSTEPTALNALDVFGYGAVTDEQQAWLENALKTGATGGATGLNVEPPAPDPRSDLPLLVRLAMLPLGSGTAEAQFWPGPSLGGFGGLPEPKVGVAWITGKIRSPQEMEFGIQATNVPFSSTVELPYVYPVTFTAQSDDAAVTAPIELKMRAQRGQAVIAPGAGEEWTKTGSGRASVSGRVTLEPGTTVITAEAQQGRDGRTLRLEAKVTELDPDVVDTITGRKARRATVTVRELVETAASASSSGISFFKNWPVEVMSESLVRGVSGANGGFSVPVFSYGWDQSALVCTEVQAGLRWNVQVDSSDAQHPKLVQYPTTDGFPVCQMLSGVAPGTASPVSLLVDLRILKGSLSFHNRDETRVPLACSGDQTTWDPTRHELTQVTPEALQETEVYFFKEDDLSTPIAGYAKAVPLEGAPCGAGQPATASYNKFRFGPSERWTRRNREECDRLKAIGQTTTDFYRVTCEGKDRVLRVRLSQGDRIVVFAVNHATGYAGATLAVVPPITTGAGLDANGRCPADDAAGGPITFLDFGQQMSVSRCATQDLTILGDIRMYPPEVDVRVARQAQSGGASTDAEEHLIRHGGAATVRDELVSVSTHWRVRLPPQESLLLPPAVRSAAGSVDAIASPDGAAWPYRYSGPKAGPAVDPFDADGDGIPDVLYDRDGDGIPDAADRCPLVKGDGPGKDCPAGLDSDGDGTPDANERSAECVSQAGPPENGGCPDPQRPYWTPPSPANGPDSDSDGIPDSLDLCPFFPGPAAAAGQGMNGCPSLASRFDTDDDGTPDTEDECPWQPGPKEKLGCPDPAQAWTPPTPAPRIAGGPGKMLETYCSELTNPTPDEIRICTRFEARLMDVPTGVPPLAGHIVRVTGTAAETPVVSVFPVFPGKGTSNVQAALRLQNVGPDGKVTLTTTNLSKANYYVHVVGNLTQFNDLNGDGRIDPATEIAAKPPAFALPANPPQGWKEGLPERAIALKNVYRSLEPDGAVLARFDRDREHEFRVLELSNEEVKALQADGTWRSVTHPATGAVADAAQEGDLAYQFLMHLAAPDAGRAGTLPGSYRVRLGSDDYGVDCAVDLKAGSLVATCDGPWLYDVLSGRDLVYLSLSMAGNAENVLYKYNLQGLSPRRDLVTAGHQATAAKSEQPDGASGAAAVLRPISEPALANVFFGPSQFKHGRVRICADGCGSGDGVVRDLELAWQSTGAYAVTERAGKGAVEQVPRAGLDAAALFRVPFRPQDVWMPGFKKDGTPPALLVEWTDLDDPAQTPHTVDLGKGTGVYQGANARAPGQSAIGGVNVADGHLSFRHEDFSLPEFAGAVRFARTYNNQDNEVGTLGTGWRHSYEAYVVEESLGRYTMVLEGQSYDFPGCDTVDLQARSAEACKTDNAHGGTLTVKERPEGAAGAAGAPRHVPDVVFTATNGVRYRFDRYSQKALQTVDDTVTARLVQEQAEYQHRTNDSTPITTSARWKKIRDAGRRRWVLTAIDDGHGRPDETAPTDTTKPGKGWTVVEYFADSDMIRRVYRKGGKLGLYFSYEPVGPTLPSRYQAAAVAESFGFLRMVEARFQGPAGDGTSLDADASGNPTKLDDFIVRLRFSRSADGRGNLARVERIASEDKITVDQAWAYGYVQDVQALAGTGKKLSGQDLWDAANELEKAELEIGGVVQSRTRWRRALTWASAYPHVKPFEIVDRVTLPGTSTVSAEAAPVDVELEIAWAAETRREIKRTDGVLVKVDLTQNYGSVSAESIGQSTVSTDWFNQRPDGEGGKVQPSARKAPGGRKLAFGSDARLRPTTLTLAETGAIDTLGIDLKNSSNPLRRFLNLDERFGVPAQTEREAGSGTSTIATPVDGHGDTTSLTVTDAEQGEIAKWSQAEYDAEGVLKSEVDGAGRETKHEDPSGQNAWGLRPVETTWLRGAANGARDTVVVTREYDWLGRVKREADDAGHVQEWTYDANGRLRRRLVKGTPDQDWTYDYQQTGDRELTVTERLAGTEHVRTRVYRDGLLVKEQWSCDGGPAVRTSAYLGGRLATSKDERGVTRTYEYDPQQGWLMRVLASGRGTDKAPEITYQRDREGKVTSETDQNGLTVVTGYDVLGRPARWSYGDGDVETVKRDANGAVTERTHGSYVWTSKVDALGRVRSTQNSDGQQVQTTTDYDKLGRKVASRDAVLGMAETWEYQDVLGRQTRYTRTVAPYGETYEETRTYTDSATPVSDPTGTASDPGHTVEIVEKVGQEIVKRRTLWLDAAGRTLHTLEHVPRGTATVEAHRYFTYDPRGNAVIERTPIGDGPTARDATASTATTAVVVRTYDPAGRLVSVKDAGGYTTTYGLDLDGQVKTQHGPHRNERWTFEYDAFGQLKTKTLAGPADPATAGWKGAVWAYTYPGADGGASVRETDPRGFTTERWYNARHRLSREVRSGPTGKRETALTYDGPWPSVQTTTETGADGQAPAVTTLSRPRYDHRGRVLEETETFKGPEGAANYTYTSTFAWDHRVADPVKQTWPNDSRTGRREVDALGNVIAQTWGTYTDVAEYDAAGRLRRELPSGKPETRRAYAEGLLTAVTVDGNSLRAGAGTEVTSYAYHASGQLQTEVRPDGRERRLVWNGRGLLEQEEYGSGASFDRKQYGYDESGKPQWTRHGTGSDATQWEYAYGPRGELVSVTQPGGLGTFRYGYDEAAALVSIAPPAGPGSAAQTFDHDFLGRQTVRTRGGATWTTSWASGTATVTEPPDASGQRVTYRAVDGRGRVALERYAGVAVGDLTQVATTYDALDQPLVVTEQRGSGTATVTYAYQDGRKLLTGMTRAAPGRSEAVAYGRTASGQLSFVTSPAGRVDYGYNGFDRLETLGSPGRTTTLTWEPGGERLSEVSDPSTLRECRRYDGRGRVTLVANVAATEDCENSHTPIARYEYGYDDRGNRTSERYTSRTVSVQESTSYGYDQADRLTGVLNPDQTAKLYQLGGDGSRTAEQEVSSYAGPLTPDGFDGKRGSVLTYGYDGRGGLTSITDAGGTAVVTYTVDAAGRVRVEARGADRKEFSWDVAGRLAEAKVTTGAGSSTTTLTYRYDHAGRRIEKQGPAGTARYVWGAGELVEEQLPGGTQLVYERAGELVAGVRAYSAGGTSTGTERLMHDGLGSVVGRVRGDASVASYRYDAWGGFRGAEKPSGADASLAYAGQHWDEDLGLSYAQQRWYSPGTGRFLSEDPVGWNAERLGQPTRGHAFGYAAGNPLLYTDPEGLDVGQAENLEREYKRTAVVQAWNSFTAGGDPASRPSIQSVYGDAWPGDTASELQAWCDSGKDPSACTKLKVGRGLSAGFTAGLGAVAAVGAAEVVLPAVPAVASAAYHSTVGPVVGAVTAGARAGWDVLRNGWQAIYSHAQELTDRIAPLLDAGGQLVPAPVGGGHYDSRHVDRYTNEIARLEERNAAALAARAKAMSAQAEAGGVQDLLQSGKSPLKLFDIDRYGAFNTGARSGDELIGHELLQNGWLQAHGLSEVRGAGGASRDNPAMAVTKKLHVAINRAQAKLGLNDPSRLASMSASRNISLNVEALRSAGVPDYAIREFEKEARAHAARVLRDGR